MIEAAKPGVSVLSLCEKGDAHIMAETGKIFKREKDMKKGSCCGWAISVGQNKCVGIQFHSVLECNMPSRHAGKNAGDGCLHRKFS